jgi:hypothetical protein
MAEALKALDLLDAFIQERLHLESEGGGGAGAIKLVTHEGFHGALRVHSSRAVSHANAAIEQLRGRVAASLQMETLRRGGRRPSSFTGTSVSTPSAASSCSGSESS